jgi:L-fuconolactonase
VLLKKKATFMRTTIIDTHLHLWNLPESSYPWFSSDKGSKGFLSEGVGEIPQIEEAGVSAVMLVQSVNSIEDTDYMFEQAARYPWIIGVIGWLPLEDPEATSKTLELYNQNPHFKGVRHLIHQENDPAWLLRDNVMESLSLLSEIGMPFEVYGSYAEHLNTALVVGKKLPDLKLVIDHLANSQIDGRFSRTWKDSINRASDNPNMYMKISGLFSNLSNLEQWSTDDLMPYIEYVLASFGTDRCFCGSNWPMSLRAASYAETIDIYRKALQFFLTPQDQQKVFWINAEQCYGIHTATKVSTV